MKKKFSVYAATGLIAGVLASPVSADILSGTWNFSADGGYTGTFSITGLDTSQNYKDETGLGFSVTTNFSMNGDGNGFDYDKAIDELRVGGLVLDVSWTQIFPSVNDWQVVISSFSTVPSFFAFLYYPEQGGGVNTNTGSVARAPSPATLALLGIGLAGLGISRRRKQ